MKDAGNSTLDEQEVKDAVAGANVPALLMTVYQFTGDRKWLGERYRPTRGKGLGTHESGGLPEDVQAEIREAAIPVIRSLQAGEKAALPTLTADETVELVTFFLGEHVDPRYGPMIQGELTRRSAPNDGPDTELLENAPEGFRVIVIGLGIAGIVGAHYLNEMGLDYQIFERNPEAGGVWFSNTYPGAGVDTPSHLYSFSFLDRDWRKHFELQGELHQYFVDALDELAIRDRVKFGTTVLSATFDDVSLVWNVIVRNPDGTETTHTADMVISAVGSLNKPRLPQIPGMDDFTGLQFHSAQWPEGLDLTGRRVAIVGAGASSMQITPRIAGQVEHLTIIQRSPQWVAPFEQFGKELPTADRKLLTIRLYRSWYWTRLFWNFGDKVIEALRVDPEWTHPDRSVNARNDAHRKMFTRYIEEQLGDRQDLLPKVLPDYPPFGKRILLDNGWYQALKRPNVSLVTEGVQEVTPDGPRTSSGEVHPVDVIIWATGFEASQFLDSYDVIGTGGVRLREAWEGDDPRAYLGVSIPEFPNFFMLGGPHSFPGSGSFMYFMEVQGRYLRDLVAGMFDLGVTAIDARGDITEAYNELVDEVHKRTVWTHPGFSTYYRNSKGRVIFVMPFLNLEYWEFTRRPDLENYTFHYGDGTVVSGAEVVGAALEASA
ncbi:flavin-containing monooxygenase [Microbacterium sp. KHB019]|uniref:flavin-containing monooxygenase n=1 Tax=Microbacterium sp. KHB019 TaxID=3129770 RepID=UPI00307B0EBE